MESHVARASELARQSLGEARRSIRGFGWRNSRPGPYTRHSRACWNRYSRHDASCDVHHTRWAASGGAS